MHQQTGKKRVLNRDKLRLVDPDLEWSQVRPRQSRAQRTRRLARYLEVEPEQPMQIDEREQQHTPVEDSP